VTPSQPAALPPTQEQIAQGKAQDLLNKLRFVTPILVRAAKKKAFIDSYLDILDDALDDESYEMLVYALQRDDWMSTLFSDNPEVVANRPWFESFREAILQPDEDTDASGSTPEQGTQNQEQTGLVP
jgi:disulfide oxidoreductase YuzD